MASFNKITIVGYLGRDPEIKYTPQGMAICNFTIATTEKRKNRDGEQEDVTTWFRVASFGKQAETISQHLAKGSQLYLEGRLRQETYTDRDGAQRQSLEVTLSDFHFIGTSDKSGQAAGKQADDKDEPAEASDQDIPF
ncbi:MAG: single-stranded DNA-binding protein [Acidobacteria bacterium]|nr:single-stranded DNA-binding protein [Acidobacteriota bacterium]